jgi:hypothetical protein
MNDLFTVLFELQDLITVLLIFCPSFIRLLLLFFQLKFANVYETNSPFFKNGIVLSLLGCCISPGLPLLYLHQVSKCGVGCGSGVFFIFLVPIVMIVAVIAEYQFKKGKVVTKA